jgi:hypothetical protein
MEKTSPPMGNHPQELDSLANDPIQEFRETQYRIRVGCQFRQRTTKSLPSSERSDFGQRNTPSGDIAYLLMTVSIQVN